MAFSNTDGTLTEALGMKMPDMQEEATSNRSGQPLVSVIIPTYNRSWSLRKSVESVFKQTYHPIECLIIDDGSTDDSTDILKHLVNECPDGIDIRYFKKENGGGNSARNRGLLESKGDFICYLDSDDMLINDSINERASVLIENPDIDFCYGLCSVRDENDKETMIMNNPWPTMDESRISRYLFHTSSPLIRRSTCSKIGLWREDDSGAQEYEYFARLKYFSSKVAFIDRILSVYVRHKKGSLWDKGLPYSLSIFKNLLAVKALVVYGKYDNAQERFELSMEFRKLAKLFLRFGEYEKVQKALHESLILKFSIKVCAQWLAVKFREVWGHIFSSKTLPG